MSRRYLTIVLGMAFFAASCTSTSGSYVNQAEVAYAPADAAEMRGGRSGETAYNRDAVTSEPSAQSERVMIRNGFILVEVPRENDIPAAREQAEQIVASIGGYVAESSNRSAVLRIPADRLDATLEQIAALGKEVRRNLSASDVTMQYTDLQIRLDNAKALQTRLRQLLEEAQNVTEAVAVETELSRVTAEVDRLEGQFRFMQNQVAFSTVRLQLQYDVKPGPVGWVVKGAFQAVKWLFVWD